MSGTEQLADQPFSTAVIERSGKTEDRVMATFEKYGIEETPAPPPVKSLRVESIAFSGVKTIQGVAESFDFHWSTGAGGIWALLSKDNLVGKSTVLQVILWALRGSEKSLSGTVRSWIHHVTVVFLVDTRLVKTDFDTQDNTVAGTVEIRTPSGQDGTLQRFDDETQFKRTMQGVMLELLGLEKIPSSQEHGGRVRAYEDGWTAYTGAFLTDSDSDAIIGENIPGTDFAQRLLQVYIGLPWAQTLFKARSRARVLESDNAARKRQLTTLKGRSVADLNGQIANVDLLLSNESARSKSAEKFQLAQREFAELSDLIRSASDEDEEAVKHLEAASSAHVRSVRTINALKEAQAASTFFGKLRPTCCPRCSVPIDAGRIDAEGSNLQCSVCTRELPTVDEDDSAIELVEAVKRELEARAALSQAKKRQKALTTRHENDRRKFELSAAKLKSLSTLGTAADSLTLLAQRQRLLGMLEVAQDVENDILIDADEMDILNAASAEALSRVDAAAGVLLSDISTEIARVAKRLGMSDVESVKLQRNAHVTVVKGGGESVSWGKLAVGEQLRLRVATFIALVRGANGRNMGRHPGFMIIDSPGKEEVADHALMTMFEELVALCKEVPNLQLFIARAGQSPDPFGSGERVRRTEVGETMW